MNGKPRFFPRVLVIADLCNPEWESVPLVGWSHVHALKSVADIHLVTRSWNTPALQRAGLIEGRDFTTFDTSALFHPMERLVRLISGPNKGWGMLTALSMPSYWLFELLLWRHFRRDLQAGRFDLVHRITPLSPAVSSPLAPRCRKAGIPFVLGPINGGLPWPPGFPDLRREDGERLARFREAYRFLPYYRATRQSAAAIMVGGRHVLADLPRAWHDKCVYVPENGIDLTRFPPPAPRRPAKPVRIAYLGRLVPAKGADMLIEAAAPMVIDGRLALEIIGDGPERGRFEALAERLGVAAQVRFVGAVPHHEVAARLSQNDLLGFPSVHEFGGAVVLEAMAMGVVPVVVDYGGPSELVSSATGFAIKLGDRAEIVAQMRAVLERVVAKPDMLVDMSAQAVARARALFSWPAKAHQTLEVYRWVLGQVAERPELALPFPDPAPSAMPEPSAVAGGADLLPLTSA
jgi:glycosyltransferase involved in cell wall biosynthesis